MVTHPTAEVKRILYFCSKPALNIGFWIDPLFNPIDGVHKYEYPFAKNLAESCVAVFLIAYTFGYLIPGGGFSTVIFFVKLAERLLHNLGVTVSLTTKVAALL
jgi:hypothetical protein